MWPKDAGISKSSKPWALLHQSPIFQQRISRISAIDTMQQQQWKNEGIKRCLHGQALFKATVALRFLRALYKKHLARFEKIFFSKIYDNEFYHCFALSDTSLRQFLKAYKTWGANVRDPSCCACVRGAKIQWHWLWNITGSPGEYLAKSSMYQNSPYHHRFKISKRYSLLLLNLRFNFSRLCVGIFRYYTTVGELP